MKSGTTWWAGLVAAHPAVVPPMKKELHFFDRFCTRPFTDADREAYWSFFARRPGTVSGEWTPQYSVDFWTPSLLRRAAPDAKLLYIVRDPIERYRSGLTHVLVRGRFEFASISREHLRRGLYHAQLTWILEHFPRSQVLVLQLERCVRDPEAEIKRTYDFLGLDPGFVPDHRAVSTNHARAAHGELPPAVLESLQRLYRDDVERSSTSAPSSSRGCGPRPWAATSAPDRRPRQELCWP